jgi:hypothetical protein
MSRELIRKLGFADDPQNIFWSYDQEEFSFRKNSQQTYIEYPTYGAKKPGSIFTESLNAAKLIAEKNHRPLVLLSGGLDSEVVALSFHLQKIPFDVLIFDYEGENEHDIHRAKAFCQKLGIPYKVKSLNILKFWENDLEDVAKKVHSTSPQMAALCWMVTQLDEYVVVGDGDSSLRAYEYSFFEHKSERWPLARWMLMHEKEGCPRFFQYTKELESSLYFEPMVEQFVNGTWVFFNFKNLIYLKPFIMNKYFECELRPKLNGFENFEICESYREALTRKLGPMTELSWTYENARKWVEKPTPPSKLLPLEECQFSEGIKAALRRNGTTQHLIWTA